MSAQLLLAELTILPVVTISRLEDAVPLATALINGGINAIEVTLRTEVAVAAIEAISSAFPECLVGAGTVRTAEDISAIKKAGAQFAISPGTTLNLIEAAEMEGMPFIPGVVTCSEIMAAIELGCDTLKVFPANFYGNAAALAKVLGLFPSTIFCPTGGINSDNMNEYLAIKNVACVGGSWLTAQHLIESKSWDEITKLAASAVQSSKQ